MISSGHGKHIRGASGYIDEVDEARRVVKKVAELFNGGVTQFHDDISNDQSENLDRIVDFHNNQKRDLDCSVHFNAYNTTEDPMGCECLYLTQKDLAKSVSDKICGMSGLKNRGPKKRTDLYFLNKTDEPAILIEVCFVDSKTDERIYRDQFTGICRAICEAIGGVKQEPESGFIPLLTIDPVVIKTNEDGSYVRFISNLDICSDGTGPSRGDPHHQDKTAYYSGGVEGNKYLNADRDFYIVIPPQIRSMVPPIVMGSMARLTNLNTGISHDGVTGEIGPSNKTGEAAYCLAKVINPAITHNAGDLELELLVRILAR